MKKLTLLFLLYFAQVDAQNLYAIKASYYNNVIYDYMVKLNNSDGSTMASSTFLNSGISNINSASFDSSTNIIYTFNSGYSRLGKYNVSNDTFSTIQVPFLADPSHFYSHVVIANGRLFTSKYNASGLFSLVELDKNTGNAISEHIFANPTISGTMGSSDISFSSETNEVVLLANKKIVKYNILTGNETSYNLPSVSSVEYRSITIVNQKLYIGKKETVSGNAIFSIDSYQIGNGNFINSHAISTVFAEEDEGITNLCFLGSTNELLGYIATEGQIKLLKFNVSTLSQNIFPGFWGSINLLGDLVVTSSMPTLSTNDNQNYGKNKKIKNAYNVAGQKVAIDTKNQVIIVQYEDGTFKKVLQK